MPNFTYASLVASGTGLTTNTIVGIVIGLFESLLPRRQYHEYTYFLLWIVCFAILTTTFFTWDRLYPMLQRRGRRAGPRERPFARAEPQISRETTVTNPVLAYRMAMTSDSRRSAGSPSAPPIYSMTRTKDSSFRGSSS